MGKVPSQSSEVNSWLNSVDSAVRACAVDGLKAWRWVREVRTSGMELKDFSRSGSAHKRLDHKLCQAILEKLGSTSPLAQHVQQQSREWEAKFDQPLTGRQVLWLVLDYFGVNDAQRVAFSTKELEATKWLGDAHMEEFLNAWSSVYDQMKHKPDPSFVRDLFIERLRKSNRACSGIVQAYDMAPDGALERTYDFMLAQLQRRIKQIRDDRNKESMSRAVLGPISPVAPAPELDKKGGKGGKGGKGKKQDQDSGAGSPRGGGRVGTRGPCFAWNKHGKCNKGDNCPHEHRKWTDAEKKDFETRFPPKGKREGSPPPDRKNKKDPKEIGCRFFWTEAGCEKGDQCRFSHDEKHKPAPKGKDS